MDYPVISIPNNWSWYQSVHAMAISRQLHRDMKALPKRHKRSTDSWIWWGWFLL